MKRYLPISFLLIALVVIFCLLFYDLLFRESVNLDNDLLADTVENASQVGDVLAKRAIVELEKSKLVIMRSDFFKAMAYMILANFCIVTLYLYEMYRLHDYSLSEHRATQKIATKNYKQTRDLNE